MQHLLFIINKEQNECLMKNKNKIKKTKVSFTDLSSPVYYLSCYYCYVYDVLLKAEVGSPYFRTKTGKIEPNTGLWTYGLQLRLSGLLNYIIAKSWQRGLQNRFM